MEIVRSRAGTIIIRWLKIIGIFLVALIVVGSVFLYFKVRADGRTALREAKNAKLSMQSVDIEAYAAGSTIFDATSATGINESYKDALYQLAAVPGTIKLTAYNKATKQILGFTYYKDHYQVVYRYDAENGECWDVNYYVNLFSYRGDND